MFPRFDFEDWQLGMRDGHEIEVKLPAQQLQREFPRILESQASYLVREKNIQILIQYQMGEFR